ncbi:NrsF family protein [Methylosinus sp. Sm6]|uniref:NrsF family protein n=1 Tax=Methylosinus sp. Sm6 TaxID=2866948 RepID=UPI001C994028|nr:DUF1109 domain-containing protein [Methylosinus sp. Sm6]MBY6242050.1 DUF1109 domain-containing protein [Methylosinus sp. Sm6]
MRTKELIGALAMDLAPSRLRFRRLFAGALLCGALAAAALFLTFVGLRPDLAEAAFSLRFVLKFVVTLGLLAAAVGLLFRLAVPGREAGRWALAPLAAPLLLALAAAAELVILPSDQWRSHLIGHNAPFCLALIPLLAILPLAIMLSALRRGAPDRPGLAGAVAGLAAGGLAAALYAAHCADDSPLFVAAWYSLAIGFVTLVGGALGSRLLRW